MNEATETKLAPSEILATPLYAIAGEYLALLDEIDAADGVMTPELEARFDHLQGAVSVKLEACAVVLAGMKSHYDVLDTEIARLRAMRESVEASRVRFRDYVKLQMRRADIKRSDGIKWKIRRQNTAPSVEITDLAIVPDEHCSVTVTLPAALRSELLKWGTDGHDPESLMASLDALKAILQPAERVPSKRAIGDAWKACSGAEDVPGTMTTQNETVIAW